MVRSSCWCLEVRETDRSAGLHCQGIQRQRLRHAGIHRKFPLLRAAGPRGRGTHAAPCPGSSRRKAAASASASRGGTSKLVEPVGDDHRPAPRDVGGDDRPTDSRTLRITDSWAETFTNSDGRHTTCARRSKRRHAPPRDQAIRPGASRESVQLAVGRLWIIVVRVAGEQKACTAAVPAQQLRGTDKLASTPYAEHTRGEEHQRRPVESRLAGQKWGTPRPDPGNAAIWCSRAPGPAAVDSRHRRRSGRPR